MAQIFNLINIDLGDLLFRLKLFSGFLSIVFLIVAVLSIVWFRKLVQIKIGINAANTKAKESASGGALTSKWEEIMRHAESPKEAEWKFAIIEADNLVDDILKSSGYLGDSMGERLMNIEKGQLVTLEGLWEAHKIRNKLAHDSNYFLRYAEARKTIQLYKNTLQELNAL